MAPEPSAAELIPRRFSERVGLLPDSLHDRNVVLSDEPEVLVTATVSSISSHRAAGTEPPAFVRAGPRLDLALDPKKIRAGIVTCGGLCPGLNDVIRSITFSLLHFYGVGEIDGFRYGYAGVAGLGPEPIPLTHDVVDSIHEQGGTLLGSSRGPQDIDAMIDNLVSRRVSILFCVGGDGTLRGAAAIASRAAERDLRLSVIGVPKTIDNDLQWVERSFGFATAVEEAAKAITVAHNEARGAFNGIGLVKLMGRHSGFIAAHATLANPNVNMCLVPEVPFELDGTNGVLAAVQRRLEARHHCVIAMAEGAGHGLVPNAGVDQSGNTKLGDVGPFLKSRLQDHFGSQGIPLVVRYIDPSYLVRGGAANSSDGEYCLALGQHAAHAGMAGFTDVMIGQWNQRFTIVPIAAATGERRQLDPQGPVWQRLMQTTRQEC